MPEGDSVHRAARRVHDALAGHTLDRAELRVPRFSAVDLRGRRVDSAWARGKHLFVVVGPDAEGRDPVTVHVHLKMEGRVHVHRTGERWRFPAHIARLVLAGGGIEVVGTELGLLRALTPAEADQAVAHLGPDLLGADWDPNEAVRRIRERPSRTLGEALLDQRNLAGIGTIYRAEVCFLRGIDPREPVENLRAGSAGTGSEGTGSEGASDELRGVVDLARRMLVANVDRWVRVTTGERRRGRELWVYGQAGKPCRRCGTLVETFRLGGGADPAEPGDSLDRVAYRCPSCQPTRARLGPRSS